MLRTLEAINPLLDTGIANIFPILHIVFSICQLNFVEFFLLNYSSIAKI